MVSELMRQKAKMVLEGVVSLHEENYEHIHLIFIFLARCEGSVAHHNGVTIIQ